MKIYKDKIRLTELYEKFGGCKKIAAEIGCNEKTVAVWMKKHGIENVGVQGARKVSLDHTYFQNINSEEKSYWFGFLMADGCVYRGSDERSYRLQINLAESEYDHLQKFQNAIGSSYKIQVKAVGKSTACLLKVNSTQMCKDLMRHGLIPRKSVVCTMPQIPMELMPHFIRGYFDGDGCITGKKKYSLKICGGDSMLKSFQSYFRDIGIPMQIYAINHSRAISLETAKHDTIHRIYDVLYKNHTVCLERKRDKFQEFIDNCPPQE